MWNSPNPPGAAFAVGLLLLLSGGVVLPWSAHAGGPSLGSTAPIAGAPSVDPLPAHPLKLSHGRIDVTGEVITARVRMFWDDLEEAIRHMTADRRFRIEHTAEADALVGTYLQEVLVLDADGTRPQGRVLQSGEEEDMFWYVLEYRASAPVRRLTIRNEIMVDLYPEQRNVLQVRNPGASVNRTFYFSSKKEEYNLTF